MFGLLSELETAALIDFGTKNHDLAFNGLSLREQQIFMCGIKYVLSQLNQVAQEVPK